MHKLFKRDLWVDAVTLKLSNFAGTGATVFCVNLYTGNFDNTNDAIVNT